jgi:hypothetical protein
MEAPESANFKTELQDKFNISQLVLKAGRDGLRHIGELFGPS